MNKQELENKINELEKQLTELKEGLNKLGYRVWKPNYGDTYYFVQDDGNVLHCIWYNDGDDNRRYLIGNCFKTVEKAKFEVERLKVVTELKQFAEEYNESVDWNDVHWTDTHKYKYYIAFNAEDKHIYYDYAVFIKRNEIYFSSKELAQQAVETIGEERIKKYYLGVED